MQVQEIMTRNPACCTPETDLKSIANMMLLNNCGAIPVVDNPQTKHVCGIVTDRDIVCRTLALGKDPMDLKACDCMTDHVVTVLPQINLQECCQLMEEKQIRRIPVVDADGYCCGIIAQADIAKNAPAYETAEVVREISMDT